MSLTIAPPSADIAASMDDRLSFPFRFCLQVLKKQAKKSKEERQLEGGIQPSHLVSLDDLEIFIRSQVMGELTEEWPLEERLIPHLA